MTSAKSLKKALICSVMALSLCFTMLLGTTFAWFTDSVTNNVNQIVAGNLDVELKHTVSYTTSVEYETVESTTKLYDELLWSDYLLNSAEAPTLWQPDVNSIEGFKIVNNGTLPLKYKFQITFTNATKTPTGKTLADILVINAIEVDENSDVQNAGILEGAKSLKNFVLEGTLEAGESYDFFTTIGWAKSSSDNEYNVAGGLKIDLGVTLVATQTNPNAELPRVEQGTLGEDDDINNSLEDPTLEGVVINNLTSDIVLDVNNAYIDLGGENTDKIVINGNNHKITLDTSYMSRLYLANPSAVLEINNATLTSSQTSGTWDTYNVIFMCNVSLNNVKVEKSMSIGRDVKATLKNVEITESQDFYGLWICAGANVEIDGLKINSGRGIKIVDEYVSNPQHTTLSIKNATFNTTKKSAIIVKSSALVTINVGENVNITNVQADSTNVVWVDSAAADHYDLVVVNGATKYQEID